MLLLRTVSGLIPYAVLVFLLLYEFQLQLGGKKSAFIYNVDSLEVKKYVKVDF